MTKSFKLPTDLCQLNANPRAALSLPEMKGKEVIF